MSHVLAFVIGLTVIFTAGGYYDIVRACAEWRRTGNFTVTLGMMLSAFISIWGFWLLIMVVPDLPTC